MIKQGRGPHPHLTPEAPAEALDPKAQAQVILVTVKKATIGRDFKTNTITTDENKIFMIDIIHINRKQIDNKKNKENSKEKREKNMQMHNIENSKSNKRDEESKRKRDLSKEITNNNNKNPNITITGKNKKKGIDNMIEKLNKNVGKRNTEMNNSVKKPTDNGGTKNNKIIKKCEKKSLKTIMNAIKKNMKI